MTASDRWRKPGVRIVFLLCMLSFFLLLHAGYEYKSFKTDEIILKEAKEDAREKADYALVNILMELNSTRLLTEGIANDLSSGKLNNSILEERLRADMVNNSDIFSIVVAYSPSINAGERYLLHCKRNGSDLNVSSSLPYDYTNSSENTTLWYNNAIKNGCAGWNSPHFGVADKTYQIDYSAPFYLKEFRNGSEVAGVVSISRSLDEIRAQVGNFRVGNTGYAFIFSEEGFIISYPVKKYLCGNVFDLANEDPDLYYISKKNITDKIVTNSHTGQSSWVVQKKISSEDCTTNWILGIVLPLEETLLDKKIEQDRSIIRIVLTTFAFLFFLFLLFISLYRYDHRGLWLLAFFFSFLCILGMGTIWHITLNHSSPDGRNEDLIVFDMADVETVLQHSGVSPNTLRIPTGVFIQSMEFSTENDVIVIGYIWQNISGLDVEKTSPNFSFPESMGTTIEKAYVSEEEGIIGWRFKATLRQQFNYSKYPFDREDVWIRLWNNAYSGGVLIPDFSSYDSMIPERLPGLQRSFVLEGWEPQKTFFSYRMNSYCTNFGVGDFTKSDFSELYFNVDIKRHFKVPLVADLLPVMVVSILLFAVLTIINRDEKKKQSGSHPFGVLSYCSSLFFSLILAHASLRTRIPTDSVIYLEYFYFIMYLVILAVSLNSIAFLSNMNISFIDKKDNLYVRLLYWPAIMGILLLITLINFY